ncbi:MAG TPA: hypothetical protein VGE02_12640 [Gemmatimonadales bacterium]
MHVTTVVKGGSMIVAFVLGIMSPGTALLAQATMDRAAFVAPVRAGVSSIPESSEPPDASRAAVPAAGTLALRSSTGRSVVRGAAVGAVLGAVGGIAMGAWVCNQGFGCSDRGRGIAYWTLAGAGAGAVVGWVLHAVRSDG